MIRIFDVLLQTARALEALQEGLFTGIGGATVFTDSHLPERGFTANDYFKGGTFFYLERPLGASPWSKTRLVTAYNGTTGAITVNADPGGFGPSVGQMYGVMTRRYPRAVMVGKIMEALREMGDFPIEDTSLTTLSNTLEYGLPVEAKRDLRQVWLARATTAPYRWERQMRVRTEWSGTQIAPGGQAATLIFPEQPRVGYKIKLVYMAPHPIYGVLDINFSTVNLYPLYVDSAASADNALGDGMPLSDYISIDWLALEVAAKCARWRLEGAGADEKQVTALLNNLTLRAAQAKMHRPMRAPQSFPLLP